MFVVKAGAYLSEEPFRIGCLLALPKLDKAEEACQGQTL
jgi:hypothetical protein